MFSQPKKPKDKYCGRCGTRIYLSPQDADWIRMSLCWQFICGKCDADRRYEDHEEHAA